MSVGPLCTGSSSLCQLRLRSNTHVGVLTCGNPAPCRALTEGVNISERREGVRKKRTEKNRVAVGHAHVSTSLVAHIL